MNKTNPRTQALGYLDTFSQIHERNSLDSIAVKSKRTGVTQTVSAVVCTCRTDQNNATCALQQCVCARACFHFK